MAHYSLGKKTMDTMARKRDMKDRTNLILTILALLALSLLVILP